MSIDRTKQETTLDRWYRRLPSPLSTAPTGARARLKNRRPDPFDLPNQIEYPHFDDLVKLMQSYEETVKEHADLITQAEKLDILVIKD